ncbi:MAG: N-methyl-L-tryptophan oxidase [Variovorax paradoxus]|nr:MAG: N-methyl-L-tryptophan oxidase [Variovorax paradoxus]PZQ03444.1 MAG: N-methyl-L-tryptophan oxidase [Variovorax paradoxus]
MHYDAIVVGLGAVGAGTLSQLAMRGARVLGVDRFAPPHDQGSSHGESRITRLALGEGEACAPLVQRSHALWRDLERRTGRQLMTTTGGLVLGPRDSGFLGRTIECAQRFGIAHGLLDAAALRARFPQFALRGDELGCYEPTAGFVRPEEAIAAQLDVARAAGASVQAGTPVLALEAAGDGVRVRTAGASHTADRVLLATGAWLPGVLADHGLADQLPPLKVCRQTMHWFDTGAAAADFAPGRFPVFIWAWGEGEGEGESLYGFPATDPAAPALKVAGEQYRQATTPDQLGRQVPLAESQALYRERVAARFPQIGGRVLRARACMYTVAPGGRFVVDALPGLPAVLVASACSGHGFKHSAGLGESLAERLLGRRTTCDLGPFAVAG